MTFRISDQAFSHLVTPQKAILTLCLFAFLGCWPMNLIAQDSPDLAWKKPEGAALFEEGRGAFDAKEFANAVEKFKAARKQAKNRATRMHIDNWLLATEGANELNALIQQAKIGKESAAYRIGAKNYPRYSQSPIGPEYKKFLTEMETKLFVVLDDFERVSRRYSEKFGKKFIDDPKLVQQGKRALEWKVSSSASELKIKTLPRNMDSYKSLVMYLDMPKGGSAYQMVFVVPGTSDEGLSKVTTVQNAYIAQMKAHRGLKRIEVPLKNFKGQGNVEWARVKDFRIQFLGGKKFTAYIDFVALQK
ncbi:hypothetical protein CBD41_02955 [bacterium TMED181]|nr:hypothetical protein [Planctomycetota bacterium]OUW46120.1 MAG: hypothetical protein CBD41_02955 [bacterium TMED181]